jgi:ubiquitin conjugation factor E4 B
MEKLAGTSTPKPESSPGGETTQASNSPKIAENNDPVQKPKININKAPPTSTAENPFAQLTSKGTSNAATVRPREGDSLKRSRAEMGEIQANTQVAPPVKRTTVAPAIEELPEYENRILSHIFRVTLDPNQKVDASGHRLIHLPNLRSELEEDNAPIRFTKDRLDSAILEACSTISSKSSVLDYLLPCWKRTMRASRGLRGVIAGQDEILKEAKRLCMSNCIFALEMPELYGLAISGRFRAMVLTGT